MVISVRFYYFYIGILKFKTTRLRKKILWWLKAWWFATKAVYGLKIYRYMKSLEPSCKLTSLRPLLKPLLLRFVSSLKRQLWEFLKKKKKRIESPLPLLFLIFQSVNATSSQEINVLNTKFSSYPSQYRSQSNKTVPHRATWLSIFHRFYSIDAQREAESFPQ